MKTKKKQTTQPEENTAMQLLPPWQIARTKERAYRMGYSEGLTIGVREGKQSVESKRLDLQEREIHLNALKNICQTGAIVVESMSKALLSVKNHL